MTKRLLTLFIFFSITSICLPQTTNKISDETQACIDCHASVTPGIVGDWHESLHSKSSIETAFAKDPNERRISLTAIENLKQKSNIVGCYECHSLNTDKHADSFDHFDFKINVVVSPNDCKTCHPVEYEQYLPTKKAHALDNLRKNPIYHALTNTLTSVTKLEKGKLLLSEENFLGKWESCYACHGTELKVEGMKVIESSLGEIEVPKILNWPNQGVGRINPDGSLGSCTSCHSRHSFAIEIARKPYTCGQCHLEPDVPAYNVYKESKHGNIFESRKDKWNWNSVPWQVGKDFNAPSCATCHNSLLTNMNGEVIAERTHNFADRLWIRLFGLIYSHPQPKSGKTYEIVNQDKLPLPTTFDNKTAADFLITPSEQKLRKDKMSMVCQSCHSSSWTSNQFDKMEKTFKQADELVATATGLVSEAWTKKLADNKNPFDEHLEFLWQRQWLFYANSVRYSSAMMGSDYAGFKNGWWSLNENLAIMRELIDLKSKK